MQVGGLPASLPHPCFELWAAAGRASDERSTCHPSPSSDALSPQAATEGLDHLVSLYNAGSRHVELLREVTIA